MEIMQIYMGCEWRLVMGGYRIGFGSEIRPARRLKSSLRACFGVIILYHILLAGK